MKDYYKILGISRDASKDEIKQAYRKLAHQYHPDKGGNESKFKEVSEAYQVLSDVDKRRQYDNFGTAGNFGNSGNGFEFTDFWRRAQEQGGFDMDFEDIGNIFGDFFGAGGARGARQHARHGKNIKVDLQLKLADVLKAQRHKLKLNKLTRCVRCAGLGGEPGSKVKECFSCRGTGEVQQIKRVLWGTITQRGVCPECQGEGNKPEAL